MKKQCVEKTIAMALIMAAAAQAAPLEDTDGNGLWDSWELIHYGGLGVDPASDSDGDGRSAKQEMLAGTNPNVAESRLQFGVERTNGQMRIFFSPLMDMRSYSVDRSASLTNEVWTAVTNGTVETLGESAAVMDAEAQQGFYRLSIAAPNAPAIDASSFENDPPNNVNPPQQAYDGNMSSRWSAQGTNEWIQFVFPVEQIFNTLRIAFHNGDQRVNWFSAVSSVDGQAWNPFYTDESSGLSAELETFVFAPVTSRWFRIVGHGNSSNDWNSYSEVEWDYVESYADAPRVSSFETEGEWSNGTINTNEYVEGSGSFQWDHGAASSISLTANYPLDLSEGDYISIWVHNELPVANEKFTLIFYSTDLSYFVKIRTDFVGWKRFVFHKADFSENDQPAGWHNITSIRFYASGWSNTLNPDRVVLLDDFRFDHFSLDEISPRFLASFESGSLAPDVGIEFAQQSGGSFAVVDNPSVSQANPSEKVLLTSLINGGRRAEYHAPRMPTQEKTYIYAWKELFPTDFGEGVNLGWGHYGVGQWKTWPCQYKGLDVYDFSDEICNGGGIFNHRLITKTYEHEFSFRAKPDCNEVFLPMERGEWHAFALEIYWTDSSAGYYNLYKDGQLVESQAGVKTLFDGFVPQTCDMMWGMGLYAAWSSTEVSSLNYYLDDMAVFDVDEGASIDDVLEWQGY